MVSPAVYFETDLVRKKEMCYISEWPKRFLKTILRQLSRHQVCMTPTQTHTHTDTGRPPVALTGPQERGTVQCVCAIGLTFPLIQQCEYGWHQMFVSSCRWSC